MTSRNRRKRRTQRQPTPHQVGAETTPPTLRREVDGTTLAQTRAPGEPAVIERVSARGAEYTHVRTIVVSVPPPLGIMFWTLFGAKSYRTVDKDISDRARAARTSEERDYAMALRWEFCLQVIRDLNNLPPTFKRRFQLLASQTGTRLVVYDISKRQPRVVEEQQIAHEIRTLGDKPVPWANLDVLSQATLALLWKYFPMRELLSWRPGRYWRTRRSPQGWPLIIRAIEMLYDYLLPFYQARRYTRRRPVGSDPRSQPLRRVRTRGDYPRDLLVDIAEILRVELAAAQGLAAAQVQAAIQRYLHRRRKQRRLKRPLGPDMFRDAS